MAQLPRSSSLTNKWQAVAVYFPGSKSVQGLLFFVIFPIYFKVRSYALEDGYMQRISKKNVCLPSDLTPLVRGLLQLSLAFMGTSRTRLCSTSGHESLLALVRREKPHTSGFRLGVAGHLAWNGRTGRLEVCYCWWKNYCTIQYEESSCLLKVSFYLDWCRISSSNRTIWYHRVQPDMYACILYWIVSMQIFRFAFMLWQPSSHRKEIQGWRHPQII